MPPIKDGPSNRRHGIGVGRLVVVTGGATVVVTLGLGDGATVEVVVFGDGVGSGVGTTVVVEVVVFGVGVGATVVVEVVVVFGVGSGGDGGGTIVVVVVVVLGSVVGFGGGSGFTVVTLLDGTGVGVETSGAWVGVSFDAGGDGTVVGVLLSFASLPSPMQLENDIINNIEITINFISIN
jgi:hypothetical protein